jgi:hypothetical protein
VAGSTRGGWLHVQEAERRGDDDKRTEGEGFI